ncbi:MAG: acyltransferase [Bdellovibrionota bacterium]
MLSFLPHWFTGTISSILFALNTFFWCLVLYVFAFFKVISPTKKMKAWWTALMIRMGENWISFNNFQLALVAPTKFEITGFNDFHKDRSYLICSNHQSWVDIVMLQKLFNRRVPFLRFFLKQELLYVPLLGIAWWALDFPFMKRYSKAELEKHPEKRGKDLETTRQATERFKGSRISILNFLEGTRFRVAKHAAQKSPFKNLLRPKAGGVAFVIEAMGKQFDSILDVTIVYPDGPVSLWGLLSGRLRKVKIHVERMIIPPDILEGHYLDDPVFRERVQNWIQEIWEAKDQRISQMKVSKT